MALSQSRYFKSACRFKCKMFTIFLKNFTNVFNYSRRYNRKPTLVIDFLALLTLMSENTEEMLCGVRFNKLMELCEKFFRRLSEIANLVFFEDGPVVDNKEKTWIKRHSEKYHDVIKVIDKLYRQVTLRDIRELYESERNDIPKITTQVDLLEFVAFQYGQFHFTFTRECDSEIARYAYHNHDVLAVLANDSDFLIYAGHWRYFSIRDIVLSNMQTLETVEYNREALRTTLNLNDQQLIILSTLNGNDIIKYDHVKETFHTLLHPFKNKYSDLRFPWLADYARNLSELPHNKLMEKIQQLLQIDIKKIEESFEMYNPVFDLVENTNELLRLCYENRYDYIYGILLKCPKTYTTAYLDLRANPMIYEAITSLMKRLFGLILNHERENNYKYEVITKRTHEEDYRSHYLELTYPGDDVPPLIELLNRIQFIEHDENRFKLLKWIIGSSKLRRCTLNSIPVKYLQDILTLVFLCEWKFIEKFEADLILLTIKHVETNTIPENLTIPQTLNQKAVSTSFLYSKNFNTIARCIQAVGLTDFSVSY